MRLYVIGIVLAVVVVSGVMLINFGNFSGLPGGQASAKTTTTAARTTTGAVAIGNAGLGGSIYGANSSKPVSGSAYDCALPAITSQWSCAALPTGYAIPPRLPNAPPAFCYQNMTQAACSLFKQTYGSGVCTPNETTFTDPFDCGCNGIVTGDPFTGRCGVPASVCLAAAVTQPQQG